MVEVAIYPDVLRYLRVPAGQGEGDAWEVAEGTTVGEVLDAFDFLEGIDIVVVVNNVPCRDRERALKGRRLPPPYSLMAGG